MNDNEIKRHELEARKSSVVPNLAAQMDGGASFAPASGPPQLPTNTWSSSGGYSTSHQVPKKMSRQEDELLIKQREREARMSTVVPNLASRMGGDFQSVPQQVVPTVRRGTAPSNVPKKMSRQEEDLLIKQREKQARISTSVVVPDLAQQLGEEPAATIYSPGGTAVKPKVTPPAAFSSLPAPGVATGGGRRSNNSNYNNNAPRKMSRQEEELLLKQRERDARVSTTIVPNLASMVSGGGADHRHAPPQRNNTMPGSFSSTSKPTSRSNSATSAVPKKMTRQEEELMIKQRERQARTSSSVAVVPNLAQQLAGDNNHMPARSSSGQPGAVMPTRTSVPGKMTRQEEELMIKQREKQARMSTSVVVPNLSLQLGGEQAATMYSPGGSEIKPKLTMAVSAAASFPAPGVASRQVTSTANTNVPRKLSRQEEELFIKQREREARGIASPNATVIPNLARMVADDQGMAAPLNMATLLSEPSALAGTLRGSGSRSSNNNVPAKMSRQEEELLIKERESLSSSTVVPNLARMVTGDATNKNDYARGGGGSLNSETAALSSSMRIPEFDNDPVNPADDSSSFLARYQAAGVVYGEEHLSEEYAALTRQQTEELLSRERQSVDTAETVRARVQAASVAMDGSLTQEDEDRHLKERERLASYKVINSSGDSTATDLQALKERERAAAIALVGESSPEFLDPDVVSQSLGRRSTYSVTYINDISPTGTRSAMDQQDSIAKSGGRRSYSQELTESSDRDSGPLRQSTTPASRAAAREPRVMVGALAVAAGRAQPMEKLSLPEQPDMPRVSLYVPPVPTASHDTLESQQVVEEQLDAPSPDEEQEACQDLSKDDKEVGTPSRKKWFILCAVVLVILVGAVVGTVVALGGGSGSTGVPPTSAPTTLVIVESERFTAAKEIISAMGISSANAISDPSTSQFKALSWVADTDTPTSLDETEVVKSRYILAVFYYELNGPNWMDRGGWLDITLRECEWKRVNCTDTGSILFIEEKSNVNMVGTLPSELNHLSALEGLILNNNQISGFAAPLVNLKTIRFESNVISGELPSAIFEMTNLETLVLRNNKLQGTIPPGIRNLVNLETLDLGNNDLSGTLTTEFQSFVNLTDLYIYSNQFHGLLMDILDGLSNLDFLNAVHNKISGSITPDLVNIKSLRRLDISDNQINGEFPNFIFNLTGLMSLSLDDNKLTGTISSNIGALNKLQVLLVSRNQVGGTIPSEIGLMTTLYKLYLDGNSLSGTIPTEIGNLGGLPFLSLSTNFLTGTIPTELGKLSNVENLFLDTNSLTGSVPTSLQQLSAIKQLFLNNNVDLTGTIADAICNLPRLQTIAYGLTKVDCSCSKCKK